MDLRKNSQRSIAISPRFAHWSKQQTFFVSHNVLACFTSKDLIEAKQLQEIDSLYNRICGCFSTHHHDLFQQRSIPNCSEEKYLGSLMMACLKPDTREAKMEFEERKQFLVRTENMQEIVEMNNSEEIPLTNDRCTETVTYRRSVKRTGHCALRKKRSIDMLICYVIDLFTTLVDIRWRYILLLYILSFLVSWFLFGVLWWTIAYAHGDLSEHVVSENGSRVPCVSEMNDFISSFLFSMETQYTTGYGTRTPTTECPEAIFLLCVQSIFGILLQAIMVGAVFTKLSRPKARVHAVIFSKRAVICLRDGQLCLMFRMGDMRNSSLVHCKVFSWLLQDRISQEGEFLPHYMKRLQISIDDGGSSFFFLWPVTVVHRINAKSPLYDMTPHDLLKGNIEVVAGLICTSEITGQTTEVRVSYSSRDILWGYRFKPLLQRDPTSNLIDYGNFHKTRSVSTVLCSARHLDNWSRNILANTNRIRVNGKPSS